jgi:hypothetical protein
LIATDPTLLSLIRTLVSGARASALAPIGAGLGRAMVQCAATEPKTARRILDFVRNLGNYYVISGFGSVSEESGAIVLDQKMSVPAFKGNSLMTGDKSTDLENPFEDLPLPQ